MDRAANVKSIDALRQAKAGVAEFREVVSLALSEAQSDVQRTIWWIQNEQLAHWKREVRKRTDQMNHARSEIYRAKLTAVDENASVFIQRKELEKAQRRLTEAEKKIEAVKRWGQLLEREYMLFRGACQGLARAVDGDLPKGEAKIDRYIEQLLAYIKLAAPQSATATPGKRDGGVEYEEEQDDTKSAGSDSPPSPKEPS